MNRGEACTCGDSCTCTDCPKHRQQREASSGKLGSGLEFFSILLCFGSIITIDIARRHEKKQLLKSITPRLLKC